MWTTKQKVVAVVSVLVAFLLGVLIAGYLG